MNSQGKVDTLEAIEPQFQSSVPEPGIRRLVAGLTKGLLSPSLVRWPRTVAAMGSSPLSSR
jgi:hypothetical protein